METQPNFEYLCRVCAANTKGKHSVAECVYILRTPSLKDKIEKYLYFTISENDPLPKVLCKTCFRQVEATASLSKIAKHTQKVFRDFMVCTKPGAASADYNIGIEPNPASASNAAHATSTYGPEPPHAMTAATIPADPSALSPAVIHCLDDPDPLSELAHKDEVIVNVSINDPLTRENSLKMIHASQKRQNSLDSKFTPKSIAQRSFGSRPKATGSTASLCNKSIKKSSPAGVINFVNGQLQPQVGAFTSGSHVVGRMATTNGAKTTPADSGTNVLQQKRKNLKLALNNIRVSNALANNSGQVSLLKSSQKPPASPLSLPQKQPTELLEAPKQATGTVATQVSETLTGQVQQTCAPSVKRMTKSPRRSPVRTSPQRTSPKRTSPQRTPQRATARTALRRQSLAMPPPPPPPPAPAPAPALSYPPQPVLVESQPSVHQSGIPEDIVLGRVIRDPDLLKLILKALKWPLSKQTMDMQMQRLRNSKFLEVMSDRNLLQDMDLTQILGPYLAPVFLAAQAIQQQQWVLANATLAGKPAGQQNVTTSTDPPPNTEGQASAAMPYKLPAETSVQLVSVSGGADEESPTTAVNSQTAKRDIHKTQPKFVHPKKMRKASTSKGREANIISDEDAKQESHSSVAGAISSKRRSSKSSPVVSSKFNVEIDPALLSEYGFCATGDEGSSNEALLALLNRQRAAVSRLQRGQLQRRRNSTASISTRDSNIYRDPPFDMEDIILMEQRAPQIGEEEPPSERDFHSLTTSTSASSVSTTQMSAFPLPSQVSMPPITRPIIKRRKTVIQASPARTSLNIPSPNNTPSPTSTGIVTLPQLATTTTANTATNTSAPTQPITNTSSVGVPQNSHATPSEIMSIAAQMPSIEKRIAPSKTYATTSTVPTSDVKVGPSCVTLNTKKSILAPVKQNRKLNLSKSALGQQLLEAIGLQKVDSQFETQEAAAKSAGTSVKHKRPKMEEPTVAHADSTTKSIVKEVLVEAKRKNMATSSTEFDVEDEIDKITLLLQNNAKQQGSKKDLMTPFDQKMHSAARISNIRRLSTSALKNRKTTDQTLNAERSAIAEARMKRQTLAKFKERTRLYHDEDSTYAEDAHKVEHNSSATTTSSETNTSWVVPRKRGRKRNEEPKDPDPDFDPDPSLLKKDFASFFATDGRARRKERAAAQVANQRVREIENESAKKMEFEMTTAASTRPTRLSKTMSKYYKSPNRAASSNHSPSSGSRGTKNRH